MVCKRRGRRDLSIVELGSNPTGLVMKYGSSLGWWIGYCRKLFNTTPSEYTSEYGNLVEAC